MLIYVCLSSHGFGHAARQASILVELYRLRPKWKIVISCLVDLDFLNMAFKGIPVEHRRLRWDIGMTQENSLNVDLDATLLNIENLNRNISSQVLNEVQWILSKKMPVIVLADIPPSAAEIANKIGAPLIWMGNFGWDDIYKPLGARFFDHAKESAEQYSQGDLVFRFPFSLDMNWGLPTIEIGLTASKPISLPEQFLSRIISYQGEIIMISFGGIGYKFDLKLLKRWPDKLFLMFRPENFRGFIGRVDEIPNNLLFLPPSTRMIDSIPYCRRLIGKPGYSSFCEALIHDLGIHVFPRNNFSESKALIQSLKNHGMHRILDCEPSEIDKWELDKPLIQPRECSLRKDGSEIAAVKLIEYIES